MISNTVGLMVLDDKDDTSAMPSTDCQRSVKSLAYFWNTDADGQPHAVLYLPSRVESYRSACLASQQRIWPISGISVVNQESTLLQGKVALLILAQVVCLTDGVSAESLQFREFDTALFVINNPYDSPQSWHFDAEIFPKTNSAGKYQWLE